MAVSWGRRKRIRAVGIRHSLLIAAFAAGSLFCFAVVGADGSESPATPALELTVESSVWGRILDQSPGYTGRPSPQLPPGLTLDPYEGIEGTSTWIHAGFNYSAATIGRDWFTGGTLYLQGYAVIPDEAQREPTIDSYAFVTHVYATEPELAARLVSSGPAWVFTGSGEYRVMNDAGVASVIMSGYHPYLAVTAPAAPIDGRESEVRHRWFLGSLGRSTQDKPGTLHGILDVYQSPHATRTGHAVEFADWEHSEGVADVAVSPYSLTVRGLPGADHDAAVAPLADPPAHEPAQPHSEIRTTADAQETGPREDAPRGGGASTRPTVLAGSDWVPYEQPKFWLPAAVMTSLLALASEYVRFAVLRVFASIGLFTRFTRDSALDHPRRELIVRYLEQNPGASFSELRREAELGSGVLSHHLRILERAGQIQSVRDGVRARFYVGPRPVDMKPALSLPQAEVLDAISRHPGASARALARLTGVPESNVYYHVSKLTERSLVRVDRERRQRRYYPVDG